MSCHSRVWMSSGAPVQLAGEIVVLLANRIAEILFDQAGSQVECRLKLGHRAQQMDLARGTALLEARAPLLRSRLQIP